MDVFGVGAWSVFGITLAVLLAIDLYVHSDPSLDNRKRALFWTGVWIAAGLGFSVYVWWISGYRHAEEYLAAYLIEKSLSLDNIFVFLVIFQNLRIERPYQRTALSWGIWGALFFRAIFIFAGATAIRKWSWMEYIFGGILFVAAYHAVRHEPDPSAKSKLVDWLARRLPVSGETRTTHFLTREDGLLKVTPLFVAVLAIETADIVFAIDSVPAALSVTREEFIVYSSNAFAILGLRALYIVLADTIGRLKYLHYGLAAVLAFAGFKLVTSHWIDIPPLISVMIVTACILASVIPSLRDNRRNRRSEAA